MSFAPGARSRLTTHDLGRFAGNTLFDRIGRVVCHVGRLPRKELYEAWELARRVRRLCRGGRVLDVAGGHGLLAHVMLLLDDSSPAALVIDPAPPPSSVALHDAFVAEWPRLQGRITFVLDDIRPHSPRVRRASAVSIVDSDLVVSSHACGALTDTIIAAAVAASARVAVLPCCHDLATCDPGPLAGWMDGAMAIDAMRAMNLESRGYRVRTQTIPAEITPKNRVLIGLPPDAQRRRSE